MGEGNEKDVECHVMLGSAELGLSAFAASEETRFAINSVYINKRKMAVTDGRIAVMIPIDTRPRFEGPVIIDGAAVGRLQAIHRERVGGKPEKPVRAFFRKVGDAVKAVFRGELATGEDATITLTLSDEARFPPIEEVIPKDDEVQEGVWVETRYLKAIVDYAERVRGQGGVCVELNKDRRRACRIWIPLDDFDREGPKRTALVVLMPMFTAVHDDRPEIGDHDWAFQP